MGLETRHIGACDTVNSMFRGIEAPAAGTRNCEAGVLRNPLLFVLFAFASPGTRLGGVSGAEGGTSRGPPARSSSDFPFPSGSGDDATDATWAGISASAGTRPFRSGISSVTVFWVGTGIGSGIAVRAGYCFAANPFSRKWESPLLWEMCARFCIISSSPQTSKRSPARVCVEENVWSGITSALTTSRSKGGNSVPGRSSMHCTTCFSSFRYARSNGEIRGTPGIPVREVSQNPESDMSSSPSTRTRNTVRGSDAVSTGVSLMLKKLSRVRLYAQSFLVSIHPQSLRACRPQRPLPLNRL